MCDPQAYKDQVERVDSAIAGHLRDRLGAVQSGEDMFRLFSRFNVLLVRPRIQVAIQQFQSKVRPPARARQCVLAFVAPFGFRAAPSCVHPIGCPAPTGCVVPWLPGSLRQLLDKVREDLLGLQDRFKARYQDSNSFVASAVRDIPPVSSVVLWVRQIQSKVRVHQQRVVSILGTSWETHVEGKQLKVWRAAFRGCVCVCKP